MEELKDRPGPSNTVEHERKKILYLCFGEYSSGDAGATYFIHAFDLKKNCYILPLAQSSIVGFTNGGHPVLTGFGVCGSNIVLAGGLKPAYDGFSSFKPYLCRDVYVFDTADCTMNSPPMIRHCPLQQGKNYPLMVEHDSKLYVLSRTSLMSTCGVHFAPAFEMLDLKDNKCVTLPEPPIFDRRYLGLGHLTNCVVVGTNIFVSCFSCNYRFDMADTSQTWKAHSFTTNCTALPLPLDFNEKSLAVELSDGNWLIFTCPELRELSTEADEFEDDSCRCCDEEDCFYEWQRTSLPAYLMSKDFSSLTRLQPLYLPDDLLPTQPGGELLPRFRDLFTAKPREIDYRILHLGGQEICLILSVDTGFESKGGVLRKMPIFVVSFEFQLSDSRDLLTIKTGSCSVQCLPLGANNPTATKVRMHGAFWL